MQLHQVYSNNKIGSFKTPEQFLELARVLPEPVLMVNSEGKLLVANQPMANMLGLRRQEIGEKMLFDVVVESSNDIRKYLQACASSRDMVIGTLTLRHNHGKTLICRSQGAVIQPWSPESPALIFLRFESRATASKNFVLLNNKIDEKINSKLFDPFFTTKPVGKGTGLGLFVSYQIVEKHGGQLSFVSTPGQGAEFVIKIPVSRGANFCTPTALAMS